MDRVAPILLVATSILLIVAVSQSIQIISPPEPPSQAGIGLFEAVEVGRSFLDDLNATTGRLLSTALEVREPNLYWQNMLPHPLVHSYGFTDLREPKLLYIIRYEQAERALMGNSGHFFEVWVDMDGRVLGGAQCK
jgi:hypothetical protein